MKVLFFTLFLITFSLSASDFKISLYGETHSDEICIEQKKHFMNEAIDEKDFKLFVEGIFYKSGFSKWIVVKTLTENEKRDLSNIYGIEEELSHTWISAVRFLYAYESGINLKENSIKNKAFHLVMSNYEIDKKLINDFFLEFYKKDISKLESVQSFYNFLYKFMFNETFNLNEFVENLQKFFYEKIIKNDSTSKNFVSNFSIENINNKKYFNDFLFNYALKWREKLFYENIKDVISKEKNVEYKIIVGRNHIESLEDKLKKAFPRAFIKIYNECN